MERGVGPLRYAFRRTGDGRAQWLTNLANRPGDYRTQPGRSRSTSPGAGKNPGMPGKLKWLLAERLENLGVKIINEGITGQVHNDRKLLTGDSPLAANNLGILAAEELLKVVL